MEALAGFAEQGGDALASSIAQLPLLYDTWIAAQRDTIGPLPGRRRETAEQLIGSMETAAARIAPGLSWCARMTASGSPSAS